MTPDFVTVCCLQLKEFGFFKPSFKCLKNKKKYVKSNDSKTKKLCSIRINIYYFILYNIRRAILIQKKKWSKRKKTYHIMCIKSSRELYYSNCISYQIFNIVSEKN